MLVLMLLEMHRGILGKKDVGMNVCLDKCFYLGQRHIEEFLTVDDSRVVDHYRVAASIK